MELIGKIKLITFTEEVGAKGFKKRDVVITTEEQYPQHIAIQFVQDKTLLLDKFKIGQEVKIGINIRGNEWVSPAGNVKYFNTIQGWNINLTQPAPAPAPVHSQPFETIEVVEAEVIQDFPF